MPSFTGTQVADEARILLNNTSASVYTNTVLLPIIIKVHEELQHELLGFDVPLHNNRSNALTIAALATTLAPSTVSTRFVAPTFLEERAPGETFYTPMIERQFLPDVAQSATLIYWSWQRETIVFVGASSTREVRVTYTELQTAVAAIGDSITITNAKNYMAYKVAGIAAFAIGQNPSTAGPLMDQANKELERLMNLHAKQSQSMPFRTGAFQRPRRNIW